MTTFAEPQVMTPVSELSEVAWRRWLAEQLIDIRTRLTAVERIQEQIMSAQDDINAAVAAIQATTAVIEQQTGDILAWIAAHPDVDTTGLADAVAALQGAGSTLDAAVPEQPAPPTP